MKVLEAIVRYKAYISNERRMSPETVRAYGFEVEQFGNFLSRRGISDVDEITPREPREWQAICMEDGKSPRSVTRMLSALRSWTRFLRKNNWLAIDIMAKVSSPRQPQKMPVFFRENEAEHLYDEGIFPATFEGHRDRFLLRLLYETGIRRSEAAGITVTSFDTSARTLKVLGKRSKERYIPIEEELISALKVYLDARGQIPCQDSRLFVTGKGRPLNGDDIYRIVKKYMRGLSCAERISPHVFRHTFATHILNEGGNIDAIKELLGHSSLSSTEVYTHVTREHLKATYKHAHPRALKQ
ncbi:MAG: tyrosine-type recombinase/integrase [Bacteroidales bacterium]|nr:tyrosine-type recombinase/integrase [Bacteroidales bacterium]